jgi:glycerol-3-phosphate acyltransferase PlsX
VTAFARASVALDAMGGDRAPAEPVKAAIAVAGPDLHVILVGDADRVRAELGRHGAAESDHLEVVHASQTISSDEDGARAVRAKPDASIMVACRMVREDRAQAVLSAGHTGAMMAASTIALRRVPGVLRPGIAVVLPSARGPVVLLDAGANAEARAEHLLQFAVMGRILARDVLGIPEPRVGLLSIGEEAERGTELVQAVHARLVGTPGFMGNVEGRDIPQGLADVVVTDGFTGNVVLKVYEGAGQVLFREVRTALRSGLRARVGGLLASPALRGVRTKFNQDTYGGAYLLGVRGLSVIAHGNAGAEAIANALRLAALGVREDVVRQLEGSLAVEALAPPPAA